MAVTRSASSQQGVSGGGVAKVGGATGLREGSERGGQGEARAGASGASGGARAAGGRGEDGGQAEARRRGAARRTGAGDEGEARAGQEAAARMAGAGARPVSVPTDAELEEFFDVAELADARRFQTVWNFNPVIGRPDEGGQSRNRRDAGAGADKQWEWRKSSPKRRRAGERGGGAARSEAPTAASSGPIKASESAKAASAPGCLPRSPRKGDSDRSPRTPRGAASSLASPRRLG